MDIAFDNETKALQPICDLVAEGFMRGTSRQAGAKRIQFRLPAPEFLRTGPDGIRSLHLRRILLVPPGYVEPVTDLAPGQAAASDGHADKKTGHPEGMAGPH
jgi:hypothetical protein